MALLTMALFLNSCENTPFPPPFSSKKNPVTVTEDGTVVPVDPIAPTTSSKNLFGESLRSDNERLNRLERAVQNLRNEFDMVQPSIRRLTAIESDLQLLIGELQTLSDEPAMIPVQPVQVEAPQQIVTPVPSVVAPAPSRNVTPKTYQRKSAPPASGGATVYDLRTGEHPGKTRIVLDINTKAGYSVDIDNNENIMIVDLPNTAWTAPTSKTLPKSSVISSYSVESSGSGHLLIMQLKQDARLVYEKMLPANGGSGQRLVLDVSAL
jgi:hypothetical protein